MNYQGIIIEESLGDKTVLRDLPIISTQVEEVTPDHKSPWLKQWTLHTVDIPGDKAESLSERLSHSLEKGHEWYADFKNDSIHFIIFRDKVFKINRKNLSEYKAVQDYGISLGIPDYQVNFTADLVK